MLHALNLSFPLARTTPGMPFFQIQQAFRGSASEVLGTNPVCMLAESSFHISGDSRIERLVRTEDNVHMPIHCSRSWLICIFIRRGLCILPILFGLVFLQLALGFFFFLFFLF